MTAHSTSLFLGGIVGRVALECVLESDLSIDDVLVDPPHAHEDPIEWQFIDELCARHSIPNTVATSASLRKWRESRHSDYLMSFGYRRMIPQVLRETARRAAIGSHFAPLPKYRGFAPLHWAILNGEDRSAVSLFLLEDEVDSGNLVASRDFVINPRDDINDVYGTALRELRILLKETLPQLSTAVSQSVPQDEDAATYACARNPADGRIDWRSSAASIDRLVRAVAPPFPGAYCMLNEEPIVITRCAVHSGFRFSGHVPGRVFRVTQGGVVVLCGDGEAVLIQEVSVDGKRVTANKVLTSPRMTLA